MKSPSRLLRQIFWITIIFTSCESNRLGERSVIKEGVGVNELILKTLLVKEVENKLGNNYDTISHNNYSVELFYKDLGASFYYKIDSPDTVFAISFNNTFKGKTEKGFDIRRMTVADMLRVYGPADWVLLESAQTLYAHYDTLGIYFAIRPKESTPPEMLADSDADSINTKTVNTYYDSVYGTDKVIEISVGIPGTDF